MFQSNLYLLLIFTLYLVNCFFWGKRLFKGLFRTHPYSFSEQIVYEFALGNIVLSAYFLILGALGMLFKWLLLPFYLVPIPFLLLSIGRLFRKYKTPKSSLVKVQNFINNYGLEVFSLVFLLFPIVSFLFLYPTAWDSLAYHLTLPKLYLEQHGLNFHIWFPESAYPIGVDSLFGMGEVLGDPRLSNFISFSFIPAICFYLVFGLRKLFSRKVLFLGLLIFLIRPSIYTVVSFSPQVDYPSAFYGLILGILLFRYLNQKKKVTLAFILIITIFSLLIKYTGLLILFSVVVTLLVDKIRSKEKVDIKLDNKFALVVITLLMLICTYWYGRNYVNTGNPVYPYLNAYFKNSEESEQIDVIKNVFLENRYWQESYGKILRREDTALDMTNIFEYFSIFIIVAILLYGALKKEKMISGLSLYSIAFLLPVSVAVGPLVRYYLPVYATISIVISYIFWQAIDKFTMLSIFLLGIILVFIFLQTDATIYRRYILYIDSPKAAWFSNFDIKYARTTLRNQDNWDGIEFVNQNLSPAKDKVLMTFDNRLYYLGVPSQFANPTIYFARAEDHDILGIYKQLKSEGITYLFENLNWDPTEATDIELYESFKAKYLKLIFSKGLVKIYQVK